MIIVFALALLAAQATLPAAADQVRERLRPFGQVCRTTDACPAPPGNPTATTERPNWQVVDLADKSGRQTGQQAVRSPWVATHIRWPETAASIAFSSGAFSTMRFTHLDLAAGEPSRYGNWQNHWITLGVGDREQDFRVRAPADGQDVLLLGTGPARFIAQAVENDAGDTLTVAMHYRDSGQVVFPVPLNGAKQALQSIGLIAATGSGDEADEPAPAEVAAPPAETAAAAAVAAAGGVERSGQEIYETRCFACHAAGVGEAPLFGSLEQWQPLIDKGMDTLVATSLTGLNLMPPMGTCISCTEAEMRAAIQYMLDNAQ